MDETNVILHENLKKLLERQGNLDLLVAKSNDLSAGAKVFYKNSKDMNKSGCCIIFWYISIYIHKVILNKNSPIKNDSQ